MVLSTIALPTIAFPTMALPTMALPTMAHPTHHHVLLTIQGASKRFGSVKVLRALSLTLFSGSTTLLVGLNGSGKSTLLKVCAGLLQPDNGSVERTPQVGYASHDSLLYGALSVEENLSFFASLYGESKVQDALLAWGLTRLSARKVQELSRGMQSRTALARAFLGKPQLLLLDEPTTSLDATAVELLIEQLQQFSHSGHGCLIASHDIDTFLPHVDRILILHEGRIYCDSTALQEQESAGSPPHETAKEAALREYSELIH